MRLLLVFHLEALEVVAQLLTCVAFLYYKKSTSTLKLITTFVKIFFVLVVTFRVFVTDFLYNRWNTYFSSVLQYSG